jgi:hypothetical protein
MVAMKGATALSEVGLGDWKGGKKCELPITTGLRAGGRVTPDLGSSLPALTLTDSTKLDAMCVSLWPHGDIILVTGDGAQGPSASIAGVAWARNRSFCKHGPRADERCRVG